MNDGKTLKHDITTILIDMNLYRYVRKLHIVCNNHSIENYEIRESLILFNLLSLVI